MKITLITLLVAINVSVLGQSNPPLRVREVDGSPTKAGINTLVVTNGSLSITGTTATITTGVSGLSDVSGTLVSSSNFRVPSGGTSSATPLQIGFAGTGLYTASGLLIVSSSNIPTMGWNGGNGNTHMNGSYQFVFGSSSLSSPDVGLTRPSAGAVKVTDASTGWGQMQSGSILLNGVLEANLGTPSNGTVVYCSDCTIANPCASGGTGALAKRLNGVWVCN